MAWLLKSSPELHNQSVVCREVFLFRNMFCPAGARGALERGDNLAPARSKQSLKDTGQARFSRPVRLSEMEVLGRKQLPVNKATKEEKRDFLRHLERLQVHMRTLVGVPSEV